MKLHAFLDKLQAVTRIYDRHADKPLWYLKDGRCLRTQRACECPITYVHRVIYPELGHYPTCAAPSCAKGLGLSHKDMDAIIVASDAVEEKLKGNEYAQDVRKRVLAACGYDEEGERIEEEVEA